VRATGRLSFEIGEFANFRSNENKGVSQQNQKINQDEKQVKFHLFLLSLTG
jgi:hypothetical protein